MVTPPVVGQVNRLVYYIIIPAMLFLKISSVDFDTVFHPASVVATLVPLGLILPIGYLVARLIKLERHRYGTFLQCSFHGNLGYIGLAVAFYFSGEVGLVRASILSGFLMLLQNVLAVSVLAVYHNRPEQRLALAYVVRKIVLHPVILSAGAGIVVAMLGVALPVFMARSLKIVSDAALPLALVVIGASLRFDRAGVEYPALVLSGVLKLGVLPGLGWAIFVLAGLTPEQSIPGLILLAAPTATLAYPMAAEMGGDRDLATQSISLSTLMAAFSYMVWLGLAA
jgi:predicted permease